MRLHHILKRKNLLDEHLERPIAESWQRIFNNHIPQLPLIVLIATSERAPLKSHSFPQERRNINRPLGFDSTHERQVHNPPIHCRNSQVILEISSADVINDDVDALVVGSLEDLVGPVLRAVVEAGRCAELFDAELDLLF
jgi:hypothetical protein